MGGRERDWEGEDEKNGKERRKMSEFMKGPSLNQ